MWEGVGERTETAIFWSPHLWAVNVVSFWFSRCSTGGPGATLLGDGFLYCILSATSLDPNSIGAPRPLRPNVAFPTLSRFSVSKSNWNLTWLLSWLSYIIVQHPLSRRLDLWNRMFDRHQAEITVMQFTGDSLPVHQSTSVPWKFFYLAPFNQPISTHTICSHKCH